MATTERIFESHGTEARVALRPLSALPGPQAAPLLGWRGNFVRFIRDPLGYLDVLTRYGEISIFAKGMKSGLFQRSGDTASGTVFAYGPEFLGRCFNTGHASFRSIHVAPPPGRGYARINWGLQWLHGDEHRKHRKMVMPAFHQKRLQGYRDVLVEATERAMGRWQVGSLVDVVEETRRVLLVFLNRAFLGLEDGDGLFSIGDRLEDVWRRSMSLGVRIPIDFPGSPKRRASARADHLSVDFDELIRKKRAEAQKGDDMLAMLLEARDDDGFGMSEDELVGHLSFLVFAGFESTIHAVAFAAYLVAQHPAVAEKLHDELSSLGGVPPTMEQLRDMPFLDGVVKESLRLLSPVPFLLRITDETVELGGYELPPRTELMLSIYHTHRMPDLYRDPNRFLPERWESIKPSTYEYMPFSVGPHMCAGWALALMEMKVMLAMFSQKVRLEVPANAEINRRMLATLGPRHGMWLRVQPQDRRFSESRATVSGHIAKMVELV